MNKSIPLLYLLPKIPANKIFYENGLSKIMHRLHVKVHSVLDDCFVLWERFCERRSLFDLWDFRFAWWEGYQYTPYFYTIYEGKTPLALLPLWFDDERKRFEWFGSDWMEDNTFLVKDEDFINVLLKLVPRAMYLNSISSMPHKTIEDIAVRADDDKYVKNVSSYITMDELLASLDKKHRYNLRRDYMQILSCKPRVELLYSNDFAEFEQVIRLSNRRFVGAGEEVSDLVEPQRVAAYRAILKNSSVYKTKFIKVFIQDYLAAVDLNIMYRDRYYTVRGGNEVERFPGIGNFLVYYEFEDAIKHHFSLVDCLQEDYSWKHKYFTSRPLLEVEKKDPVVPLPPSTASR